MAGCDAVMSVSGLQDMAHGTAPEPEVSDVQNIRSQRSAQISKKRRRPWRYSWMDELRTTQLRIEFRDDDVNHTTLYKCFRTQPNCYAISSSPRTLIV